MPEEQVAGPRGLRAAARRLVDRTVVAPVEERVPRTVAAEVDRAIRAVHEVGFRSRRDLLAAGERAAARRPAEFSLREMPTARVLHDPQSTLRYGPSLAPRDGMALEFGVFAGRSLEVVARARGRRDVYGFDSFRGLPEDYRPLDEAYTSDNEQVVVRIVGPGTPGGG